MGGCGKGCDEPWLVAVAGKRDRFILRTCSPKAGGGNVSLDRINSLLTMLVPRI